MTSLSERWGWGGPYLRLGLTLVVVAALGLGITLGLGALFPGFRRLPPGAERVPVGVSVVIAGQTVDLGRCGWFEAVGLLEDLAQGLTVLPHDAHLDRATQGVVPALEGRRLDVAATVAAAVAAKSGSTVAPVWSGLAPAVSLADFPDAPLYAGHPAKNQVTIILNVAWGDEFLDPISSLVEGAGGRLTICPVGTWLAADAGHGAWLAAAVARGHEVGNHGFFNQPMTYGDAAKAGDEIQRLAGLIRQAGVKGTPFFAPPMGAFDQATLQAAAAAGYRTVLWSLDTVDWRLEGVDVIAARVIDRVKAGDIILCHPTAQTAPAMAKFLPAIQAKGLKIVTLSELLSPALPTEDGAGGIFIVPPD
jgi:peptidoglycan/xylan/chitin deacetylase (PgdA/CDA1 family)